MPVRACASTLYFGLGVALGKPSFNGFWAQQEVTGFDPHSTANGLMFNTLFDHKKVVLGENNNMEWCMQDKEGKGCQKQGLTFDRSTGAFNPKTGMYTVRMRTTPNSLNSRTMMRCSPHQCPPEVALCYGMHADVRNHDASSR